MRRVSTGTRARTRLRAAALAAIPLAAILATTMSPTAQADVDSVSGSAYAAALNSSLLGQVIAPTPLVSGSATEPTNSFGPIDQSTLPVDVIGLLHIGVLNGFTQGDGVAAGDPTGHFGFALSRASAADIVVGLGALTIDAVESVCRSDGDGSTGSTELVGAVLGGNPLLESPLPNTVVELPGILSIVLNEQTISNAPGSTSIRVRALHITVLPGLAGLLGVVDVIIGESNCAASGPDVNSTTTSSTTSPPTSPPTTGPPTTPPPTTAPPTTRPPDDPAADAAALHQPAPDPAAHRAADAPAGRVDGAHGGHHRQARRHRPAAGAHRLGPHADGDGRRGRDTAGPGGLQGWRWLAVAQPRLLRSPAGRVPPSRGPPGGPPPA